MNFIDVGDTLTSFTLKVDADGGYTLVLAGDRNQWAGHFPRLPPEKIEEIAALLVRNLGKPIKPILVGGKTSATIQFSQQTLMIIPAI